MTKQNMILQVFVDVIRSGLALIERISKRSVLDVIPPFMPDV
ncbi:hypothetical protein VKA52_01570 [Halobacillus sp. HZG1]|nr:hypothetical protein [Halobacillus sp. HZG1]